MKGDGVDPSVYSTLNITEYKLKPRAAIRYLFIYLFIIHTTCNLKFMADRKDKSR